ncbi:MAG: methylated-DNA--[protein]-cysteine S-methyltransferase [Christensenellales bacterium]|jgi:methylated-DNA-[protein]-cysteine S-methyltransferase|nr:methylated-DNA--[protein]-cysteine S-methyltransferase [Clostridiales bacterium]
MANEYYFNSPIGLLKMETENGFIVSLRSVASMPRDFSQSSLDDIALKAFSQLKEYFNGQRKYFDLPIKAEGSPFCRKVWQQLRKIPYGSTASYSDIASLAGNPKAARAVGRACNKNPVLILIPCHRVVGKNGNLTGFACGADKKKLLLDIEIKTRS